MVGEWNVAKHWWNDADREEPKYTERNMSYFRFAHPESHVIWRGIESGLSAAEKGFRSR
jgi:hypothetical protein